VFSVRLSAFVTILMLTAAAAAGAHDIPTDVTVQAFVKADGSRLRLLVRVPIDALRDMPVPTRAPGVLDLDRIDPLVADNAMLWIGQNVELFEGGTALAAPRLASWRVSVPGDQSFTSYDRAIAHVTGPRLSADEKLYWPAALVDALFEYPIRSDQAQFSIHPKLGRLGVHTLTVLRFVTPGGAVRAFEYPGDPGLVRLDPRWHQAALTFVQLGFRHILDGTDHLLFLLCLVIPFRRFRALVPIVTAFTVAHSVTLIASAYNLAPDALWFPPLIETLIAMSIVYMALENIVAGISVQRRWIITFGFGLVHGFGFSFALRQTMQFAGSHLLTSLLSFNVGVELGQLLVLAVMIPALDLLFRFVVEERIGTIILSALVAHTAWHWMVDRGDRLRQYAWPAFDLTTVIFLMRGAMAILIAAGLLWMASGLLERPARRRHARQRHQPAGEAADSTASVR
jgi:HupE/UreJ protein